MPIVKNLQSIQEMREFVQKVKQTQLEFGAHDERTGLYLWKSGQLM